MKKLLCPQCKIAAMYVMNDTGERRLVYVTSENEVVPKIRKNHWRVSISRKYIAWAVPGRDLPNAW